MSKKCTQVIIFPSKTDFLEYHTDVRDDKTAIELHLENGRAGDVSDGYHTFNDLYAHRMALTLALVKSWPSRSWRSKQHNPNDTPIFEGFFIVGMDLHGVGQITYHYKLEYWNAFNDVRTVDYAPKWDGHGPEDVVERLNKWSENI